MSKDSKKYRVEFTTAIDVDAADVHEAKKKAYLEKRLGAPGCCAVYELDEYKKYVSIGLRQDVTAEHDRPAIRMLGSLSRGNISDNVSLDCAIEDAVEIIEVLAHELGLSLDDIRNWSEEYDIMHTNYMLSKEKESDESEKEV